MEAALDSQAEALINQLPTISQIGYGYSALFSGSQFLPEPDSSEVHTLVFGSQAPTNSPALEGLVRLGVRAAPALLKHLDDSRQTRIPPVSGMMWMRFADEYDYNSRVRKDIPKGVNKKDGNGEPPTSHTITVGDLCFVALGQIVNRQFNATRYQPSGGLIVSSPTHSTQLCAVVRADFEDLTEQKHRDLLTQDFLMPDSENRRIGAARRLAFYYPKSLERLILKQLAVPTYDVFKVYNFVRDELYPKQSQDMRKAMFNEFIRTNGQAFSDGVLLALFDDLEIQTADEQHRLSPGLKQKYDARAVLVQLYGYPSSVNSTNKPYAATWSASEEARFIKGLEHYKSGKVDEAVHAIFAKVADDDYLAVSCMERLIGKGHDEEIRRYCQRRIPLSEHEAGALRELLAKLDSKAAVDGQPAETNRMQLPPTVGR